ADEAEVGALGGRGGGEARYLRQRSVPASRRARAGGLPREADAAVLWRPSGLRMAADAQGRPPVPEAVRVLLGADDPGPQALARQRRARPRARGARRRDRAA